MPSFVEISPPVSEKIFFFSLKLNVPVNNFSVMSGWSQCFLGLTNTVGN